eukprot:scaffold9753_cov73-Cylindrotheca_fusiformis.AAC.4
MIQVGLERIGLNEGLERIGIHAFCECESLREVDVPSTIEVIAYGLKAIGRKAFLECFSLSHIRTPQSVNSIAEESSFNIDLSGCRSLFGGKRSRPHSQIEASIREFSTEQAVLLPIISDGLPFSATSQVDEFGMTPLHVLSSESEYACGRDGAY